MAGDESRGDLMATMSVQYHVGCGANAVYGEEWNGSQVGILHHAHFFTLQATPFKMPGDPQSGLIPLVSADPPGTRGEGDKRVQAYCFRMCLTDHPDNRLPVEKPQGYDPGRYEVLARVLAAGWREIIADHERYQKGKLWFLAYDDRVPADIRTRMQRWCLPKDEYGDKGHWSPQLYIREAQPMIGDDVLTEHGCLGKRGGEEADRHGLLCARLAQRPSLRLARSHSAKRRLRIASQFARSPRPGARHRLIKHLETSLKVNP